MLLREIKNIFHLELDDLYPKEEVDSFFYLSIEHYLNLERFILALQPEFIVSKEDEQPIFEVLTQLKLHRPIQYIIGKTTFMDFVFHVDENVLIPRPETEELVSWIIQEVGSAKYEIRNNDAWATKRGRSRGNKVKILDIGTGSGCIVIALAKHLPKAKMYALDVFEKALEVAKKNAEANEVEIEFIKMDILNIERELELDFDIIVSNPPYVRTLEKAEMSKNVLENEPDRALFVPDNNPLLFYKSIVDFAKTHLKKDGKLFLEINQYLAKETQQLLEANNYQDIELRKDLFGNYRMLRGKAPNAQSVDQSI